MHMSINRSPARLAVVSFFAFALLLATSLFSNQAAAQLTGTRNIPGDYAELAAAITDLNAQGVGAGGVILNVIAANPQTAPTGGYRIATATSSVANPVTVQGNGNTVTASAAHTVGALNDAVFKIVGSDNVTITGFTLLENPANTLTGAATNTMTEWGIALLYAEVTDGAQNATIQGNTIDLSRTYQNTFGIYSNSTHSEASISTGATATGPGGGNSGLRVLSNVITDVNIGIVVVGPTAAADHNQGVDIGGTALATGNTISNYGTIGTFSSYVNVSGTVNGILVRNTRAANIQFNDIASSDGGTVGGTLRGIFLHSFSAPPTGAFAHTISNNRVSLRSAVASGAVAGIVVESGASTATGSVVLNSNDLHTSGHTVASSGAYTGISLGGSATAGPLTTTINGNTFTNLTLTTTGGVTLIGNSFTHTANATVAVNNNAIVTQFSKTGAGGTVRFYDNFGSSPATVSETNTGNTFSNVTLSGTGATTLESWRSADGATPGSRKTITSNTFNNLVNATTGTTTVLAVSFSDNTFAGNDVSGNTISNVSGTGAVTGIVSTSGNQNLSGNLVHSLSGSGVGTVTGILVSGGTTQAIAGNKVYNIENSNAAGAASGITVSAGSTANVFNNLLGDIRAPNLNAANSLFGINLSGGTTINASFNTVRLAATSAGALFGSSALSASTTPNLTLRNNVLVNASTATGAGISAVYRRSSATLTTYAAASNNNAFFAGAPGPNNAIFTDGTDVDQTLAAFKARVAGRDAQSVTENPGFLSTAGASSDFLHIDPLVPTQLESGGVPVAGIAVDFDGNARSASFPDIGADEFNGVAIDTIPPSIVYAAFGPTTLVANRVLATTITDPSGVAGGATAPRIYFSKNAGVYVSTQCAGSSPAYSCTIDNTLIGAVTTGDVVAYFVVAQDTAGNVTANPSAGFAATNVNTITTPPTTPATYSIVAGFPAASNVGTGETITSLTNPGGLFAVINAGVLTANVVVTISTDLSGETGAVALLPFTEEGTGGYTLTIRPSGTRQVIGTTAATTAALLDFNGADRVTIDGLNSGGNSLLLRDLGTGLAVRYANDASNHVLRNTTVESATNGTMVTIGVGTVTGNDNIQIVRNTLRDRSDLAGLPPFNLVGSTATSLTITNSGLQFSDNQLFNFRQAGVFVGVGTDSITVARNTIFQTAPRTTALFGIAVNGALGANLFTENTIRDLTTNLATSGIVLNDARGSTVSRNRIFGFPSTTGSTAILSGIVFNGASGTPAAVTVVNNFVSIVPGFANAQVVRGIFDFAFGGNTFTAAYNSIYVGGTASGAANSWALSRGDLAPTTFTARNNIAFNARTGGTGSHFAAGDQSAAGGTFDSNNNVFAGTGAAALPANLLSYGTAAAGTPVTFAAWQAGPPTRDANSVAGDPASFGPIGAFFVDAAAGDLHLQPTATAALNAGAPFAGVTIDIDADPRSTTAPEIGADELPVLNTGPTLTPVAVTRTEGNPAATVTVANVSDAQDAATALAVTVNGGASATINGVTVGGLTVDAGGVVSANVLAACLATTANFTLRATDTGSLFDEDTLTVTVLPNIAPTLSYAPITLLAGQNATVNPATGPGDSGTVTSIVVQSLGTYTGGATVAATGVVSLTAAAPVGTHTLVIRATDNCGAITNANLPVTVDAVATTADLSMVKTSSLTLGASGLIQYTLQVANAGPLGVTGAVVLDNFAASLSNVAWTCAPTGAGAACPASGSGNINTQVDMANGTGVVFAITAQLPTTPPASIVNTATVTAPVATTDPNAANNSSTVTDVLALFANGFEPLAPTANVLRIEPPTPGLVQRLALPASTLAGVAVGAQAIEALSIVIGDNFAVLQVRRIGDRIELRGLQRDTYGRWTIGAWQAFDARALVDFEFSTLVGGDQRTVLQSRVQVTRGN